jgi:hypothetical protein
METDMRKAPATIAAVLLTATSALLAAIPALAQPAPDGGANVNLVGQVGGQAGIGTGAAVGNLTDPVGSAVGRIDGAVKGAVDTASLTLATREQVRAGAELYDTSGNSVGTVQSIEGDTAVVIRGGKLYNVPIAEIYHGAVGATHGLVTKLSRAEITARTTAEVETR